MNPHSAPGKSPWPLGITLALLTFAGGLLALIIIAVSSNSDLVVENYYEEEIRYNQQLDRLARTERVADAIEIRHDARLGVVILTFPQAHTGQDLSGEVHLYRPSSAGMDRKLPLEMNPAGMQVISVADLAPGLWQVKIQWTVAGEEYYVEERLIVPAASA